IKNTTLNSYNNNYFLHRLLAGKTPNNLKGAIYALGVLNHKGDITKLGRRMAEFPLDPMMYKCSEEIASIAAMLNVNSAIFYRPNDKLILVDTAHRNFFSQNGDHLALLKIYNQWVNTDSSTNWCYENFIQHRLMRRARDVRDQLVGLKQRVEMEVVSNPTETVNIRKVCNYNFNCYYYSAAKNQCLHRNDVENGTSNNCNIFHGIRLSVDTTIPRTLGKTTLHFKMCCITHVLGVGMCSDMLVKFIGHGK
ncbi:pre-mRNA-splicing factor ATP-dependent RNA helicase DHX16, partial [Aphis craccivora]